MIEDAPQLPPQVDETISTISRVHAEHHRNAKPVHRAVAAATAAFGSPAFVGVLTLIVTGWIALNLALPATGHKAPDPPPFAYLTGAISLTALYLAAMILTTQRHDDDLATHRDQLTLELAILSDQRSAKIIQLLEELRHNDPQQSNEADPEAEAMAVPADPGLVLDRIRSMNAALRQEL